MLPFEKFLHTKHSVLFAKTKVGPLCLVGQGFVSKDVPPHSPQVSTLFSPVLRSPELETEDESPKTSSRSLGIAGSPAAGPPRCRFPLAATEGAEPRFRDMHARVPRTHFKEMPRR